MTLKENPELRIFLSTYFSEAENNLESDQALVIEFSNSADQKRKNIIIEQINRLIQSPEFPLDEIGMEANRWFTDINEAHTWLENIVHILEKNLTSENSVLVKDSNGTILNEGDSVQVIKDLKVKGSASDLKRGTLIKKIHLIENDPEAIECRVDGSTLVLKTCFLKKS